MEAVSVRWGLFAAVCFPVPQGCRLPLEPPSGVPPSQSSCVFHQGLVHGETETGLVCGVSPGWTLFAKDAL